MKAQVIKNGKRIEVRRIAYGQYVTEDEYRDEYCPCELKFKCTPKYNLT